MKLNITVLFIGNQAQLQSLREDLVTFNNQKKKTKLAALKESHFIRNLVIGNLTLDEHNHYVFGIHFDFKKGNPSKLFNYFKQFNVEVSFMCESEKANVWIVDSRDDILKHGLIPNYAAIEIIADYIDYSERNIITDHYNTIKLQGNKLIFDDHPMTKREIRDFIKQATINHKPSIQILEPFIDDFRQNCITSFDKLEEMDSKGNNQNPDERTSLLALILVSLFIFIIIFGIAILQGII